MSKNCHFIRFYLILSLQKFIGAAQTFTVNLMTCEAGYRRESAWDGSVASGKGLRSARLKKHASCFAYRTYTSKRLAVWLSLSLSDNSWFGSPHWHKQHSIARRHNLVAGDYVAICVACEPGFWITTSQAVLKLMKLWPAWPAWPAPRVMKPASNSPAVLRLRPNGHCDACPVSLGLKCTWRDTQLMALQALQCAESHLR